MYAFQKKYAAEWGVNLIIRDCPPIDEIDPTLPLPAGLPPARPRG